MRIVYSHSPDLPRLAWLAAVDRDIDVVAVYHGHDVEVAPTFFFEGAWGGEFADPAFHTTEVVFGTGAILVGDDLYFVPSVATTEFIFYHVSDTAVVASNSLPLLLARVGDELDPAFPGYADVNDSILHGVREMIRRIPTRRGYVSRLMHHNLKLSRTGVEEVGKADSPRFANFAEYHGYLADAISKLVRNARSADRKRPLQIYSTQSRGYDSTAVNALAAPHGLSGVFTITRGKGGGAFSDDPAEPETNDDGTDIAAYLGVGPVIPLERRAFERAFRDEVYYHAGIHECQDANFKQLSERLDGPALLLTGTLGEMWYTADAWYGSHPEYLRGELHRADLGGHGLNEVRLRAGYTQVAVPFLGARNCADILRITESAEMTPWRLGNEYDRPIPRRIGESAGVPRDRFGTLKVGSVVEFARPEVPYDPDLRQSYIAFLIRAGLRGELTVKLLPLVRRLNALLWFASESRDRVIYYALRAVEKLRGEHRGRPVLWADLRGSVHCFSVNECVREYRNVLSGAELPR